MSKQLAIAYRPLRFQDVVGQRTTIVELQKRIIDDNVPQTLFFSGPTGTGKNTIGFILAKALVCENHDGFEPCNHCRQCVSVNTGEYQEAVQVFNGSNLKVDAMRELEENILTPDWSNPEGRRVFIIEEWQEIEQKAQKNMLPLLERDLDNVHIIVLAMSTDKIPQATTDRLVEYRMKPIHQGDIVKVLSRTLAAEGALKEESQLDIIKAIAENCNGSMRRALRFLERVIYSEIFSVDQLIEEMGITTAEDVKSLCDRMIKKDTTVLKRHITEEIYDDVRRNLLFIAASGKASPDIIKVLGILNRASLYPYRDQLVLQSLIAEVVYRP